MLVVLKVYQDEKEISESFLFTLRVSKEEGHDETPKTLLDTQNRYVYLCLGVNCQKFCGPNTLELF